MEWFIEKWRDWSWKTRAWVVGVPLVVVLAGVQSVVDGIRGHGRPATTDDAPTADDEASPKTRAKREKTATGTTSASASDVAADARPLVPTNLDGFVLATSEPFPMQLPGLRAPPPTTGREAKYVEAGSAPKLSASLLVDRTSDPLDVDAGCTKGKTGAHDSILCIDSDESETCSTWRAGDWRMMLCAFPVEGEGSRKGAAPDRLLVERLARAAAQWSDAVLDESARGERAKAFDVALASADSVAASRRLTMARLRGKLPAWVASAEIHANAVLRVEVTDAWLTESAETRRREAVSLWKAWATLNTPTNLDASCIDLFDQAGRRVGGSGVTGGSSITVK